ncbi:MAG: 2,3-bisphosphoglycerate-independent phosphoglycerate mutase, partial [Pseudomonadota bacterium]
MSLKPVVLCILDGWGLRAETEGNAPTLATTPNFDRLWETCPHAQLTAHGEDVGLPPGQMGNSEVGHTNIGAGRVVWMDLPKIDNAIECGDFFANASLVAFMQKMKASGGTAHLMGLVSPGGVHSHQRHIAALAMILSKAAIPVAIHAFMDGRDVPPKSGREAMTQLLKDVGGIAGVRIATVCGRFYAMDRDKRWDRVERAFLAMTDG